MGGGSSPLWSIQPSGGFVLRGDDISDHSMNLTVSFFSTALQPTKNDNKNAVDTKWPSTSHWKW